MGSALFVLVSLIMASTIVSSVNEKRKRQAFLMMPSTNLEKYLSLLVYTSVICVACISLALVLGDCLRMVWFKTASFFVVHQVQASVSDPVETYHGWSSALPKLIENLTPNVLDPDSDRRTWFYIAMNLFVIFAIVVWNLSLMVICGTLLRKYAFVVASLIIGKTAFIMNRRWVPWPMCSQSCCLYLPSSTTGHRSISSRILN